MAQAAQNHTITDLDALAQIGDVAAALGATGLDFANDIGATLSATTTANVATPSGPIPKFHDSGFRSAFQDGGNQVRHFSGAFVAGGAFGSGLGQILNTGREAVSLGRGSVADIRLGNRAAHLGHLFATGQLPPSEFGRIIRKRIGP